MAKYLVFIGGITAGIGVMIATSALHSRGSPSAPVEVAVESVAKAPTVPSPFAVVEETPLQDSFSVAQVDNTSDNPDIAVLLQRIESAENRIEELEIMLSEVQVQQLETPSGFEPAPQEPLQAAPQPNLQSGLLDAGFELTTVERIQTIRNDLQLERLELRDRAIREGWIDSEQYREERRDLFGGSRLRETLGEDDYDKLLLAEGRDNRVRVDSVIENSAADVAGILVGDIFIRYADERIYNFRALQRATTQGERDESVNIQLLRGEVLIDYVIPRGPMGVTLSGISVSP